MKTSERHRLKSNELAHSVVVTRDAIVERQRSIIAGLIVVAVIVVGLAAYFGIQSRSQNQAGALLAEAMTVKTSPVNTPPVPGTVTPPPQPGAFASEAARAEAAIPKFLAAAQAYPNSKQGLLARLQAAALQAEVGKLADAEKEYLELTKLDPSGLYGRMGKMGLAEVHARSGNFDQAIATYKALVDTPEPDLPLDGVLMQLARTYAAAGKTVEAKQAFTRVADEFPQSTQAAEARRQADALGANAS